MADQNDPAVHARLGRITGSGIARVALCTLYTPLTGILDRQSACEEGYETELPAIVGATPVVHRHGPNARLQL